MSRYSGPQGRGAAKRVKAQKQAEAEARNDQEFTDKPEASVDLTSEACTPDN